MDSLSENGQLILCIQINAFQIVEYLTMGRDVF